MLTKINIKRFRALLVALAVVVATNFAISVTQNFGAAKAISERPPVPKPRAISERPPVPKPKAISERPPVPKP